MRRPGAVVLVFNPNDVPVEIESLQLEFSLGDQPGLQFRRTLLLDIGARNRERIRLTAPASTELREQLQSLAGSGADSLPYELRGELAVAGGCTPDMRNNQVAVAGARPAPIRTRDFLHPMPGQPNRFR